MPLTPPSIFVPATGGSAPSAPPALFTPATGGDAPDAPPGVFVPASGGGGDVMTLTDDENYNSTLPRIGTYQGSAIYSDDAANLVDPTDPVAGTHVIYRPTGGVWTATYKTDGSPSTAGLTEEQVTEAGSVASPDAVAVWGGSALNVEASSSISAPPAIFGN